MSDTSVRAIPNKYIIVALPLFSDEYAIYKKDHGLNQIYREFMPNVGGLKNAREVVAMLEEPRN